jgi:Ca-activated chloride channel family protein
MGPKLRYAALLGLLLGAGCAHAGDFWDRLWRTPDQRGEQLLRQGDAATAARTFTTPQRKAYAELQAGDYAAAARDFAAFDDSDAHYNRGNALAHAGDLPAALKAYDAALARNPNNGDARHNRDLVAQALKQPQPPASSSREQSGKQTPGKDSGKGSDKGSQQGSKTSSASSAQQSGDRQGGKAGRQQQAGQSGNASAAQEQAGARAAGTNPAPAPNAGDSATQPQPSGGNEAEQARRDAESSLGHQENDRNQAGAGALAGNAPRTGQWDATRSEQQLAQEQWLRQIPDDPGGLLRRKFMIEHLMRQQGNQP